MFRFLKQILRISLMRRFMTSVRDDGLRVALAKLRAYSAMRWNGSSHTSLTHEPAPVHMPDDRYLQGIWAQLAHGEAFHVDAPMLNQNRRSIALIGDLNLPQCRKYRVEQLAAFWQAQGVSCDYSHYQDLPRATRLLSQATHLIEYRLQSTPLTEMLRYEARRLRLPILYDIDDPLFSIAAYETYGNMQALDPWMKVHFLSEAPKYLAMMNGADMLSMSTPGLADHASQLSVRPVHVRRNFADEDTLRDGARAMQSERLDDGLFRVAFASGSQGHEVDFKTILPAIEAFVSGAADRRLMLLGHFDLNHLPQIVADRTEVVPFSDYDAYLEALSRADCAVMPLADDLFNRCKSAVRVIDASSVGVPSIVGQVGDLAQMVEQGKTGFVADTIEDWQQGLAALYRDRRFAADMGRAARETLEKRWSAQPEDHIISPELLEWING
ncbi:hypothetical protein GCM10007385_44510 [Tateyamaria omphalii]|uniref:glycosyltransferase n=1 Tax=Tateyamaria omphalii TaxID=299262 RepID=UPI001994A7F4|nr:glycosyltransferase [Tateyamaria omphalii]GGX70563.1 hypothetical protein GCM10007385_44510 [Tateyamaria omphalii]